MHPEVRTAATLPDWTATALGLLAGSQLPDGGWPYFAGGPAAVEPTATAVAALHALDLHPDTRRHGLEFIASMQAGAGALRPQPSQADPTAMAAMAAVVLARCGGNADVAHRVADVMLTWKVQTQIRNPVFSNDPSIKGFPWTPNTFSWVEPTAYAVLLFAAIGRADDPRIAECRRLLVDRSIPGGGWNYGNSIVYGTVLEADPLPTAFAILGLLDDPTRPEVTAGAGFLRNLADRLPSPLSLAWTRIALRALGDDSTIADARFGPLLTSGTFAPTSPWHHAAALLAVAPLDRNPFILRGSAA